MTQQSASSNVFSHGINADTKLDSKVKKEITDYLNSLLKGNGYAGVDVLITITDEAKKPHATSSECNLHNPHISGVDDEKELLEKIVQMKDVIIKKRQEKQGIGHCVCACSQSPVARQVRLTGLPSIGRVVSDLEGQRDQLLALVVCFTGIINGAWLPHPDDYVRGNHYTRDEALKSWFQRSAADGIISALNI